MKREDVDDDRREDRQRERDESVGEKQDPCGHFGAFDQRQHVARRDEGAEELRRRTAHWRLRKEMEKPIETEHEKDETENRSRDRGFHGESPFFPFGCYYPKVSCFPIDLNFWPVSPHDAFVGKDERLCAT